MFFKSLASNFKAKERQKIQNKKYIPKNKTQYNTLDR